MDKEKKEKRDRYVSTSSFRAIVRVRKKLREKKKKKRTLGVIFSDGKTCFNERAIALKFDTISFDLYNDAFVSFDIVKIWIFLIFLIFEVWHI